MLDSLTNEFKALLGTTMESVLNRAMFEIMRIFENSLHDHQLELAHKGEEVVQLKIKLQRAEIQLRDARLKEDRDRARDMEMNGSQNSETQQQPADVQNASVQTSARPEPDIEVPDDWCAPLGCEIVPKQEDGMCPSVRLRKLSIPLWHIPIKKEMTIQKNESQQQTKSPRRSKRGCTSNNQDKGVRPPKIRGDISKLLNQNAKLVDPLGPRRTGKTSTGKKLESTLKTSKEDGGSAATKSKPAKKEMVKENKSQIHTCSHCKKKCDSENDLKVHVQSHRWCSSCKRFFPSPSMLQTHKPLCGADELRRSSEQKCQTKLKETAPTQQNVMPSTKKTAKRYYCLHCNLKFRKHSLLRKHMFSHKCEKLFSCSICSMGFRVESSLKSHISRMHKIQENSEDTGGDLSWTEPLEVADDSASTNRVESSLKGHISRMHKIQENSEDTGGDLSWTEPLEVADDSASTNEASAPTNHFNVTQDFQNSTGVSAKWKECGTLGPKGFVCNVCLVVKRNKLSLVEHYCVHTGEKLYKCLKCNARFRFNGQFGLHTKQCRRVVQV